MNRDSTLSWGKRALDLSAAAVALGAALPLLLGVALLVRWRLGRPVLFRQDRPGLGGATFRLFKFRTMSDARDAQGRLLPDGERLTSLGKFLRASSLDELPSLLNILRGEMSLVGPRPLLVRYLERYSPEQARRHAAKPGLTGWAQVNGRNAVSWEERFRLDVWYVDHWSFALDLKIIWLTVVKVLRREGITAQGHASMPEFEGSDPGAGHE
ncbi:MAG: sugar transferase [Deltaproteobacteria bacterium]|nr:sugar transferase [Deltaproteobacteria bacterium]